MTGIDIVQALNQNGADSIGGKHIYDIQVEFFSKEILPPDLKERFLDQAKSVHGTEEQGIVVPGSFFTITEGFVELAQSLVENLKDGRFEFIGRGSGVGL